MIDKIEVSVICNTYNHEKYIRDALESFISQKTTFKFEIIVHEDKSTDSTASIVKEFEDRYPDIIKPIYEEENQYSKHIGITRCIDMPLAKGKYIAFCEGDDFWSDEYELQKQFEILENNTNIVMCCHSTERIDAETRKKLGFLCASRNDDGLIDYTDCLSESNFPHLSSMFFRKDIYMKQPDWFFHLPVGDYPLRAFFLYSGNIYYVNKVMSCYRVMSSSSWSLTYRRNFEYRYQANKEMNEFLRKYDNFTDRIYHEYIEELIQNKTMKTCIYTGHFEEARQLSNYKNMKIYMKLLIFIGKYCPKIVLSALQLRTSLRIKVGKA